MTNLKDLNLANLSNEEIQTLQEAESRIDSKHGGKIVLLAFNKE